MNLKASFFNYNFLKENIKKSKGIVLLFVFVIPIFTYLFMLLLNNNVANNQIYFPNLSDLSIPALIGMYVAPFVIAGSLFSFVFKKDSVDFINALPLKRETIFITNIIGGIAIFLAIFIITTLVIFVSNLFFDNLVIPIAMYFHYFITFFITYIFAFIASSLTVSLTGNRITHVALTLIILFIPGFLGDFYKSRIYNDKINNNYFYPTCNQYDRSCSPYEIYNHFIIENSLSNESGATLPYKYISIVPQAFFASSSYGINYTNELQNVYNLPSIIKMIILSVLYFIIGLYTFTKRKMEIAEITFKNEHVHQIVKCLTIFPVWLAAISLFVANKETIIIWIFLTIVATIYVIYDLITRRNSRKFMESAIYFLALILSTIIIYSGVDYIGNKEAKRMIERDDVINIGLSPNIQIGYTEIGSSISALDYKITNKEVIDLIFDNANKKITNIKEENKLFAIRLQTKEGRSYYFNMRLTNTVFDKLLDLLNTDKAYEKALKDLPYDRIYGIRLGNEYLDKNLSDKVIDLIKKGYETKSIKDIINATYFNNGLSFVKHNLVAALYIYEDGIKTHTVNTMINPDLINYVIQMQNRRYIKEIKNMGVSVARLGFSMDIDYSIDDPDTNYLVQYFYEHEDVLYRYINDNIKADFDFTGYTGDKIFGVSVYQRFGYGSDSYQVFLPKDETYQKFIDDILAKKETSTQPKGKRID